MHLRNLLHSLQTVISAQCSEPIHGWPERDAPMHPPTPSVLPVLGWLERIADNAPAPARDFTRQLGQVAASLEWRRTYARENVSDQFWERYGWTEFVGKQAIYRDPTVSMGLLLLGPETFYPEHWHPAVERYVPLSGCADWYDEHHGWRSIEPLTTIVHPSMIKHAMRTYNQPLLAFFHWSGAGIEHSATMD